MFSEAQANRLMEVISTYFAGYNFKETHGIQFTYDPALVEEVAKRCTEVESGARNVDNILTNTLLPDISRQLLALMVEGQTPESIHVTLGSDGAFGYSYSEAKQAELV